MSDRDSPLANEPPNRPLVEPLSERELEIVRLMAEGLSNQAIADRLYLSLHTVKWHNAQIFSKLGVKNRAQAVSQVEAANTGKTAANAREQTIPDRLASERHLSNTPSLETQLPLPAETSRFMGRQSEVNQIRNLLTESGYRLLTLTGPGGIGKTRLSIHAAREMAGQFREGVCFVDLAPLTVAEHIVPRMTEALGLEFGERETTKTQLLHFLQSRQMLLVLDNFEQVIEGRVLVAEILAAAPQVRLLITSREKLGLSTEFVLGIDGLAFPAANDQSDPVRFSSVSLFLECARHVLPGYQPDGETLEVVAQICRRVEGMPLAIQLVAGWLDTLSVRDIVALIGTSLDYLEVDLADLPERQRSMRLVFNEAWGRLTKEERQVLARFSVFRGGATRPAVEVVTGMSLRELASLIRKSLVRHHQNGGRYDAHELVRQYAEEQAKTMGQTEAANAQHALYYLDWVSRQRVALRGHGQKAALDSIEVDFENIRLAWKHAVEWRDPGPQAGDFENSLKNALENSCEAVFLFCSIRSRFQEGVVLLGDAERRFARGPGPGLPLRVWRLLRARRIRLEVLGFLPTVDDRLEGELVETVALAREADDPSETAFSLWTLGEHAFLSRDYQRAHPYFEDSLALYEALGDERQIAVALQRLGMTSAALGRLNDFEAYARMSLEVARRINDQSAIANAIYNLGSVEQFANRIENGITNYLQALALRRELDDRSNIVINLGGLAFLMFGTGRLVDSEAYAQEAYQMASQLRNPDGQAFALNTLALLAGVRGDYLRARNLAGMALTLSARTTRLYAGHVGLTVAALGLGQVTVAHRHIRIAGRECKLYGVQWGKSWVIVLFALALANEQPAHSVVLFGGLSLAPVEMLRWLDQWTLYEDTRMALVSTLGQEAYDAAFEQGKAVTLEAMLDELLAYVPTAQLVTGDEAANARADQ